MKLIRITWNLKNYILTSYDKLRDFFNQIIEKNINCQSVNNLIKKINYLYNKYWWLYLY